MKYVCKITDKSQTTCILRSIAAHFLPLFRGASFRGRTCRQHGQTLGIFFPSLWVVVILVFPPRSAEMGLCLWCLDLERLRPHSVVLLRSPFWYFGNISVSAVYLLIFLSCLRRCQLLDPWTVHVLCSGLVFGAGGC